MTGRARKQGRVMLDERLTALQPVTQWARPQVGWIRAIRGALGMTHGQLGDRLGISEAAVRSLERNEASDRIRIDSLRRAAAALDCDLVVAMVPRTTLSQTVSSRAEEVLSAAERRARTSMALEDQSVPGIASARTTRRTELIDSGDLWRDEQAR